MKAGAKSELRIWPVCLLAMMLACGGAPVCAQDYPSRSITVVVPFPAGGASDVVARIVTNEMAKILGQSMIIENVGGAGGTVGSGRAAASAPDGYTLLAAAMGSHVAAPVLTPNLKYDPVADFVPIGITAHSPAVIIARKDFPAQNLKEFVAILREKGDAMKQGHGGIGASSHMACVLFNAALGTKPTLVAYRGSAPALNDVVGGHIDFLCEQSVSVAESVLAGSVKAYAIGSGQRLAQLPDVPTAKEAGVDYEMSVWAGLFAPKATPPEVIAKLAAALDKSLDEPVVRERLAQLGGSIPDKAERNPAAFDSFVRAEIARWSPILATAAKTEKQ
jgi:tripartite-type tricarboxylate transporter receptor subunit TctC